jgi:tetratricopeptide (TPR) repeat protein
MATSIDRSGNLLLVGDFVGSMSDSPNGHFTIGWYCAKTRGVMDDKNFVLLQSNRPVAEGVVTRRISDGRVCDTGRFALQLIGKTGAITLCLFEPSGQEFFSKQFRGHLQFYDLSSDGRCLFWSAGNDVHCTELATMVEVFGFDVDARFYPTGAKMDTDGVSVSLRHAQKGWYRFTREGEFLDKQNWFQDYIQDCSGIALYQAIKALHQHQGLKDAEEANAYAQWIEEALRRGIEDSFHLKVSTVYEYLAELYTAAGNTDRATAARDAAEQHLDGFRLVDRATSRFGELGNPVNQELAKQLVADLDRAQQTQRLFEYPTYIGKLFRTKGEILELLGDTDGAIMAYRKALEANPKAGCRKQLEKLSGGPVVLPEKPKPKLVEERIRLEKLTMFHFRCPVCGGSPKEIPMLDYLAAWNRAEPRRLESLFGHLLVATLELRSGAFASQKGFQAACDELVRVIQEGLRERVSIASPFLVASDSKRLLMHTQCPVCDLPPGKRTKDNYFTVLSEACGVQSSNLFYELGAITFGLCSTRPPWVPDDLRQLCDRVRPLVFRAGEAIGLPSCPQCGRFTSCVYGGSRSDPEKGMCRWCLDTTGANKITITVDLTEAVQRALDSESG